MEAMAVFSKLIVLVVGGHLLECAPYNTGATVMLVCVGVLVCVDGVVPFFRITVSLITLFSFTDSPTQAGVVLVFAILTRVTPCGCPSK